MEKREVESLIEAGVPDATAHVYSPRHHDDDNHLGAVVVSPAFEGKSLVDRHQRVHDALEGHLTRDIHAIELRTYTPDEFDDAVDDLEIAVDEDP